MSRTYLHVALSAIVASLREPVVGMALGGGLAVSVRAEPRFTDSNRGPVHPVATIPHLIATKVNARGGIRTPQDRADLAALSRGFCRCKHLTAELDELLAHHSRGLNR